MKALRLQSLCEAHLAVLLFGCTGPFAKYIELPAFTIVLGRTLFAALALFAVIKYRKQSFSLRSKTEYMAFLVLGALLASHWTLFFLAVKLSTVAIGLLAIFVFPIVVAIVEPYFFRQPLNRRVLLLAFVAFAGVYLIVPEFDLGSRYFWGVITGLASGLAFAVILILSKKYVAEHSALLINFYQCSIAAVILLLFFVINPVRISLIDVSFLLIFGVVFTALAFSLFVQSMKRLSALEASMTMYLEPVYGILIAFFALGESPSSRTIFGGILILGSAFLVTLMPNIKESVKEDSMSY